MPLPDIRFASLLSYVPRRRWRNIDTEKHNRMAQSVEYMVAWKNNHARFDESSYTIPQMVAYWCTIVSHFDRFFDKSAMLVPIPSHHPTKPESLWVPKVIADSLKQNRLGCNVVTCLERTGLVQQSSKSTSQDRPTVKTHYSTLKIKDRIDMVPQDILLVDDVITRGTTIAAAYIRMAEAYPNARIKAFAAMNTTFPDRFKDVIDPRTGTIVLGEPYPQKKFDNQGNHTRNSH